MQKHKIRGLDNEPKQHKEAIKNFEASCSSALKHSYAQ